jgi:hypothetical protein
MRIAALLLACGAAVGSAQAQTVNLNGSTLVVQHLAGVGRLSANLRDEHGETFGSISGLVADASSWARSGNSYSGVFYASPDRGYNVAGTIDYTPRINRIAVSFMPAAPGSSGLAQNQISLSLTQSTLLHEALPGGGIRPFSGLDPVPGGVATGGARPATGLLPELPQAFNGKLSLDAEGIVVLGDGSRLISDEYGPSIYRFSAGGQFMGALPVAASVRPLRNGVTDYSSNNPSSGQPAPTPANPSYGRSNNQGFEGLSLSPDGRTLFVALQSAARQDGGTSPATRDTTRLFTYDVSNLDQIRLSGEYAVKLPKFQQGGNTLVAAQSEVLALSDTQLLILPRDSNGQSVGTQRSLLRRVDVIDISAATNLLGSAIEGTIAPGGVLDSGVVPAEYRAWLDINDNAQLGRFGLVNGSVPGLDNLSEKWEGLALLPALDPSAPERLLPLHRQRQRFRHHRGLPGRCRLQRRQEPGHHVSRVQGDDHPGAGAGQCHHAAGGRAWRGGGCTAGRPLRTATAPLGAAAASFAFLGPARLEGRQRFER